MSAATAWDELRLAENHRAELEKSGISPAVALERGYRTATVIRDIKRLGFSEPQCQVPGLLLPIRTIAREIGGYQYKPNIPRVKDGRPHKYESPAKSSCQLDVPPRAREWVLDHEQPLVITEGIKKDDSAASHEIACVALAGVWNFRSPDVVAALDQIPLKNRTAYLAFDSDYQRNGQVKAAKKRLAAILRQRGATVYDILLPETTPGIKVGLDDYLANGGSRIDLFRLDMVELTDETDTEEAAEPGDQSSAYTVKDGRIAYRKRGLDGDTWLPLSNFAAEIVEEVIADDGADERGELVIRGKLDTGKELPAARVQLARFPSMDWVIPQWGTGAVVNAGMGAKDRLREGIQRLSKDPVRRRVYTHPGWRRIDEDWYYLHAGGAIGLRGSVSDIDRELGASLARLRLPDPPEGDELAAVVRAVLDLRDVAPDRITAPLLGSAFTAPLCEVMAVDASLFLEGQSGVLKSELLAQVQRFFGPSYDRLTPPGSFLATVNALEKIVFDHKDALCVVDDFAPTGSSIDQARYHATADRLFRGIGNRAGRGRMTASGELRREYVPRGLVASSGEDIPRGQSCRARLIVCEVEPGDVDRAILARFQSRPDRDAPAAVTAAYVRWLAGRINDLRDTLPIKQRELRTKFDASHPRTPNAIAYLAAGWWLWLRFTVEMGALTRAEAESAWERAWQGLVATAAAQSDHQQTEEPAERFIELLGSAIARGDAHIASPSGGAPRDAEAWGWKSVTVGTGLHEREEWREHGDRVGWLDADNLYLEPTSAYATAQRLANHTGGALAVQPQTLYKRLHQAGYLKTIDEVRGYLRIRKTVGGQRRAVLHLAADSLSEKGAQSTQTPHGDEGRPSPGGDPPRKSWVTFADQEGEIAHDEKNQPNLDQEQYRETTPDSEGSGSIGLIGLVFLDEKARETKEGEDDALFAANVAEMRTWTPEELERFRREMADVPDDDPTKAYELAVLAKVDAVNQGDGYAD